VLAACSDPVTFDAGPDVAAIETGIDSGSDGADLTDVSIDASDVGDQDGHEGPDVPRDVRADAPGDVADPCDQDGDGFRATSCGGDDCDDARADVHPGAIEPCDGVDENCDGNADVLPDGGFDPAADMQCEARHSLGGTNVRPTHCFLVGSSTPCGPYPASMGPGACFGCYHPTGSTSTACDVWCDGALMCGPGMCPPSF
jgi:hypothetical protein